MRKRLRIFELRADLGSGSRAGFEFAAMCVFGCEFGMVQRGGWITLGSGCVCVCVRFCWSLNPKHLHKP